jgi:hypothetical protein
MNLYKALWSKIGGRPWTYIWRDIYHQAAWVIQMLWFWTGVAVVMVIGWDGVLVFLIAYTYGYIQGHFQWGTKYQKGQKGE